MSAWATVALTLGSTSLGIAGTLGATSLQGKFSRQGAERQVAGARRERAAGIIGKLRTLLSDALPDRVLINLDPENTSRDILKMHERFEPLRDGYRSSPLLMKTLASATSRPSLKSPS